MKMVSINRTRAFVRRLAGSRKGAAYLEFAYVFPACMVIGVGGIEATNFTMSHMRISQVALSMADNASRIGQDNGLALTQFSEGDVVDTFAGGVAQAGNRDIVNKGRIVLSSLELNSGGNPYIHWQRCTGKLKSGTKLVASKYGKEGDVLGNATTGGMGPAGSKVIPPTAGAIMFVEIYYDYEPMITTAFFGRPRIAYTASFIVRDRRDLTKIYTTTGVTAATC
jgi:Flp pilus assembly protein TadG